MSEVLDALLIKGVQFYKSSFKASPTIAVCAPAKINLMGDHVDHNEGTVLAMGLPLYIIAVGAKNESQSVVVCTDLKGIDLDDARAEFLLSSISRLEPTEPPWANYIKGTMEEFRGYILDGFNLVLVSNIPSEIGLSSSAALCVATYTFLEVFTKEFTLDKKEKAVRCVRAEKFAGRRSNIVDFYSIACSKEKVIMSIDCRDYRTKYIPFYSDEIAFVLINSNIVMPLDDKEEEERIRQCEEAAEIMGVKNLREAKVSHLKVYRNRLMEDEEREMRARHVISENLRSEKTITALMEHDYKLIGRLMNQSHISLKYDYEVTCPEIDEIIDIVLDVNGVYGARLVGRGRGGCVVAAVKTSAIDELVMTVRRKYSGKSEFYIAEPTEGVQNISYMIFNMERKVASISKTLQTQLEYAVELFTGKFSWDPEIAVDAPGRITILGEHTEFQKGYVLQMAIPLKTIIVGRRNYTNFVNVVVDKEFTGEEDDYVCIALPIIQTLDKDKHTWPNLVRSALLEFKGTLTEGYDIVMVSTIPKEVGFSNDSSVVCALYTFLEIASNQRTLKWIEKARRCFVGETVYTLNDCSLADHMTIIANSEGHISFIDTLMDEIEMIPFPSSELAFLVTMLPDETPIEDETRFPDRVIECKEVAIVLNVNSLREVDSAMLEGNRSNMSHGMYKRGKYILDETIRAHQGATALKMKDYASLGALMVQSNNSLRQYYENESPVLNQIVALTMKCAGVLGSKIIACKYNKCTLTLVRREALPSLMERIHCGYKGKTMFWTLEPVQGAQDISESLTFEMRRRQKDVEMASDKLTIQSVDSEDLKQLSWSMFDLSDEWADWDAQRKVCKAGKRVPITMGSEEEIEEEAVEEMMSESEVGKELSISIDTFDENANTSIHEIPSENPHENEK